MAQPQPGQDQRQRQLAGRDFVGRHREIGELKAALEDALSGQGRLVMLAGEPGIGKTRTAQELAAVAAQWGAQVLWGWCYEEPGAPPYWPWLQPIRAYIQKADPGQLRSEMGPGAADIAEVIPELRDKLAGLEPPPPLEPEQARFRLFDSIAAFLKNAAHSQSLVLVLDDLHWADRPSLLLLEFVAREVDTCPLLIIGTYREVEVSRRHPLSQTLGGLLREQRFLKVQLAGLTQEEVGQLIQRTAGVTPPPPLVEAIHRRTEGNPLFLGEVLRMLTRSTGPGQVQEWLESWQDKVTTIPEGIRDAIGRHFNHLSEGCRQVMTTASVIGREFDFKLLRVIRTDLTEEQMLQLVEEALEAHVLDELPGAVERYQFSHALVQETLLGELSSSRRVRWHARIAEALEELYSPNVEAHAAELAYHFSEAEPVLGSEKLVHYSLLAGERALATYAWEDALAHFERALAAKGVPATGTEPAKDAEAATLLFGLGRAQLATLERRALQEAVATLERAFDYYAAAGDVAGAVAVAQYPMITTSTGRTGVAGFIPRALKLVPHDSLVAGRLLCNYGAELGHVDGDYENAHAAFAQALAIASREADSALEVQTLAAAAYVDHFHLRFQEGLEKARRGIELADRLGDHRAAWLAHHDVARILTFTGEAEAAQRHAAVLLDLAERLRGRSQLLLSFRMNATLLRLRGDWQGAREFNDRGLAIAPLETTFLGDRVLLEYQVGEFDQGEAYLERLLAIIPPAAARPGVQYAVPAAIIPWVAQITGQLDRLDIAATTAQVVVSSRFSVPLFAVLAWTGLGLLAVLRGDAAAAAEQYEHLQSQKNTMQAVSGISADRLLGLLAQTMGNLDKAAEHFEDGLAFCRMAGYRPELAWTCYDYAEALLTPVGASLKPAPTPAHQEKAISLLDEALAISQELGMRPLMGKVMTLKEQAETVRATRRFAPTYPDGLTQREVEVLRLIAAGKTDREIAGQLVISIRTVGNHVSNILNKTSTANRTEAATYAARHRLV